MTTIKKSVAIISQIFDLFMGDHLPTASVQVMTDYPEIRGTL